MRGRTCILHCAPSIDDSGAQNHRRARPGTCRGDGRHEELLRQDGVYRRLHELGFTARCRVPD